jgi:hypothetical protein
MSRVPIRTKAEAEGLDTDELIAGYHDGRAGEPEPGDNRSLSFWHGWRNGAVDGGHRPIDQAQRALAADYAATTRT